MLEGMLKDICGTDIFTSIFETLSVNMFSNTGDYSAALSVVESIHETVVKPVALMIMCIYFMIAIVDKLSSDNFTWEYLWRQFAMFIAAKLVIDYGFDILEYLFDIGMAFASNLEAAIRADYLENPENTFDAAKMIKEFKEGLGLTGLLSVFGDIIMIIFLIIPWALSWIMRLAVSVICYSRVIEIYLRATFAPIALSDFFHSGLQGTGWRFLKSFAAVCLQGAFILMIAVIFSALFEQLAANKQNLFTFTGTYLAFFASAVMLMFKSLSLTKEMMGVN